MVTTPTSRLQQVTVRSTAPPGHAMTVLVVGRGQFSVVVPEHVQMGEMFQIALPAMSLESLNEEILSLQVRRLAEGGFGVLLHHSKNRQVVEVDAVEPGSPADQAGFKVRDVVVELAGVKVEGRVPEGLVEAMDRVKSLSADGQDMFEWKLRRAPQQSPPVAPSPALSSEDAQSPDSPVVAAAVPSSWGQDDDEDAVMPRRGAGVGVGGGGSAPRSPSAASRLSEAEQEAVRQLVNAGAAALNSATDATGFQRAMLKFDSALQLLPTCEEARYGRAQAQKALDFSAMAAPPEIGGRGAAGSAGFDANDSPRVGVYSSCERTQPGALPIFRVVSGAKVRQGRETTSGLVRDLEPGSEIEVLEMALDSARRVRLRGTEGWVSVQAENGQLLLEECFHPAAAPQVCAGEKKVCECEVSLRRPCGYKTKLGKAQITTKRLCWRPSTENGRQDWREAGVNIPLQRIIAAREKGGGLGFGLTDGFELVFDTGPAWWFKEAEIDPKATTWSLLFVRQGERRDEFASLLEGARKDCKRLENITTPETLIHARVRRLCRICVRNPGCKAELESWHAYMKQHATGRASSSDVLDKARHTVRTLRDSIFVAQEVAMREAVMSCPAWLARQRDGPNAVRKMGWVRLLRVGSQQSNDLWKRRYLVLHSDSLSWYVEEEAATRQHAPPTPLALFRCVEIVRLVDIIEISAGDTPLIMRVLLLSSTGGESSSGHADTSAEGEAHVDIEMERPEDVTDWMQSIWSLKTAYASEQQQKREVRRAAAAELLASGDESGHRRDSADGDVQQPPKLSLSEEGMQQLESELMDATALPPGLEEEDSANTEILGMIVAYVERIALLPWVGVLLRCAHECALTRVEDEMGGEGLVNLEENLKRSAFVPQTARVWGIKTEGQSPSNWAAPAAVLTRLQTTAFGIGAEGRPGGASASARTDVAEAEAALPSSLFEVLVEARDVINDTFIQEHNESGHRSGQRHARVLGADDLLPIFIFALARSAESALPGAGVGAMLLAVQEWMTRIGASTDADAEEYMCTLLGGALLSPLVPGHPVSSAGRLFAVHANKRFAVALQHIMGSTKAMRDVVDAEQAAETQPESRQDLELDAEPELALELELDSDSVPDAAPASLEIALPPPLAEAPVVEIVGSSAGDSTVPLQVGDVAEESEESVQ